jgi:DNA-binding transcriptional ArsR family regulator
MPSIYDEENGSVFLKVFGASPQLRLLDFFMDNLRHDFSRREIMDAIGMAKRTLYEYLPVLLEEGAVKVNRRIGRAELYALNRESPIVRCFIRLEKELTQPTDASSIEAEKLVTS